MPALTSNASSSSSHHHTLPAPSPGVNSLVPSPSPGLGPSTSSASTHSLPLKPHGVRAHLAEFLPLPRHAIFAVKLTIHQLWNVPLVSGEFCVKWKFQKVHRIKHPSSTHGNGSTNGNGVGVNGDGEKVTWTATPDSSGSLNGNYNAKGKGREVIDSEHESLTPSGASMLSIPSTSEDSSSPSASASPRTTSVDLPATGSHQSTRGGNDIIGNGEDFSQEPRGRTRYVALREHNVKWGESVKVAVQMAIQRDSLELQPCELKLVVEQLAEPGEQNTPRPRLGVVYLNLAEYVDEGPVTRRYLLRESKVNATLQLTLELTHIGGSDKFKAPPLRKGEVMAGVATLLEKSKKGTGGGVGGSMLAAPGFERTLSRPSIRSHRRATDGGSRSDVLAPGRGSGSRSHSPAPELGIGGLRTTDNIIEAIFNPVPTSSPAPSPFTYYVPPKSRSGALMPSRLNTSVSAAESGLQTSDADGGEGLSPVPGSAVSGDADVSAGVEDERAPSIAPSSSARSVRSVATSASRSSAGAGSASGSGSGSQKWWKKLTSKSTSRPSSPSPRPSYSPVPASTSASVQPQAPQLATRSRSWNGDLRGPHAEQEPEREDDEEEERLEETITPQIVIRRATAKSHAPPPLSSTGASNGRTRSHRP